MECVVQLSSGWRIAMEDAHVAKPQFTKECSLFCVFDGHGGP